MPKEDNTHNVTTQDLLSLLIQKISERIENSETLLNDLEYCLNNGEEQSCFEINQWFKHQVPRYVTELRISAALAQSPYYYLSWRQLPKSDVNRNLNMRGIYKEVSWDDLTEKELSAVQSLLNRYIENIEREVDRLVQEGKISPDQVESYKDEKLVYYRYQHYLRYQFLLGEVHFFQYLSQARPQDSDFLEALGEMKRVLDKEKKLFLTRKREFEVMSRQKRDYTGSVLQLMDYSSLLEEVLLENPHYCNLATALMQYRSKKELKNSILTGIPLLVVSFILPPITSIVVGLAVGGVFAFMSYKEFDDAKTRYLGHVYAKNGTIEIQDMSSLNR